ncbi:hypothetical protein DSO57_1009567 [Entomophthora muscae]|uniref:Uncharacterized protein n=1 Tax=Entomophthora muscae TaxID=34485 RepID=A0ACC2RY48_9FUNG|nr:hypothetical protein DSO57_1009567 [Entomophthora muscae]
MDGGVEALHGTRPEKVPMTPVRLALRTDLEKKHHELTELGKPPTIRKPGKYFRILAIDGGGVRGIIPALVIKYIEERTGKKVPDLFNLVAGTSTGALLGVVLSIPGKDSKKPGYTSNDTMGLYITECPRIFKTSLMQRIKNMGGWLMPSIPRPLSARW